MLAADQQIPTGRLFAGRCVGEAIPKMGTANRGLERLAEVELAAFDRGGEKPNAHVGITRLQWEHPEVARDDVFYVM